MTTTHPTHYELDAMYQGINWESACDRVNAEVLPVDEEAERAEWDRKNTADRFE